MRERVVRSPAFLAPIILVAALAGCVTSGESPSDPSGAPGAEALEFPGAKSLVQSSTILHEVWLIFEMDRLPRAEEEPLLGRTKQPGEQYLATYPEYLNAEGVLPGKVAHRFAYEPGKFLIGGFRYPAQRNARLFIFQERPGPFAFSFRGRRIRIERQEPWKPAVLYNLVQEKTELDSTAPAKGRRSGTRRTRTVTRILQEEVQAGPHRVVAPTGSNEWEVDGNKVPAPPGGSITIDRQGNVRASS